MPYIDQIRDQLTAKVKEHFALSEREAHIAALGYTKQSNVRLDRVTERRSVSKRLDILNREMMALIEVHNAEKAKEFERELTASAQAK